jgi:hypothetical protein
MVGSADGERSGTRGRADGRARNPIDQWFELFVYAPLGLALDAREIFPRLVDRGRSQVVLARVIGKYAVKHGSTRAGERIEQSQAQVAAVLQTLGWLPEEHEPDDTADVDAFESDSVVFHDGPGPTEPGPTEPGSTEPGSTEPGSTESPKPSPPPAGLEPIGVGDLAIPDYDNLSASQVVPRLAGLSTVELEAVRRYEAGGRGRKTILNKIAQLQAA